MADKNTKVRKGSKKVANTRRSEKRRNRYTTGLRDRINALNKLEKSQPLHAEQLRERRRCERRLDKPRRKVGYGRSSAQRAPLHQRMAHVNYAHDGHGHRTHAVKVVVYIRKGQLVYQQEAA